MIPAWVDGVLTPVEKLRVHQLGLRHKAISVFVMAGDQLLIQRRAFSKYHTPGLWANTCCTHPHWGEASADCAARRLEEELGITGLVLEEKGQVEYRADVGGGLIEHELVDLYRADIAPEAAGSLFYRLNPQEVAEIRWISIADLRADVARNPEAYTPWLAIYLAQHHSQIFNS